VGAVRAIESVDGTAVQVGCSLGITMVAAPVDDTVGVDRVLARADEAMFQAKRAGKNQFYLQWANL
jgi:GGDEF domain-containing protein